MAAATSAVVERDALGARPAPRRSWAWLGLVPFFLFSAAFVLLPVAFLVAGSLHDSHGNLTAQNYADVVTLPKIVNDFRLSVEVSLVTALGGAAIGFLLAYAVIMGGLPAFLRDALMTFCGVASNFAGVPLALAFLFTLGQTGLVTLFLRDTFGFSLYQQGFTLYNQLGLELVYMYFQFPLMVLIIAPAIDGLKKEWREAAENLGASSAQYWRRVALPILTPSLLGAVILLFGNAFGAQATAYQLTGGLLPLITIDISNQISGDVLHNVGLGNAIAVGMIVVMSVAIAAYLWLSRISERWLR